MHGEFIVVSRLELESSIVRVGEKLQLLILCILDQCNADYPKFV